MISLFKIVLLIGVLLFLIRMKWDLGLVLLLGAGLIALLFGLSLKGFGQGVFQGAVSLETLNLVGIFWLVIYLGHFLKKKEYFRIMIDALKRLVPEERLILALPPAFIGLLPMLAGAMLSAPIVEEAGGRWKLDPAKKTFFNYWFRHIWEYCWPLYANLIIAAAVLKVPISRISLHQFPFTVLAAGVGVVVLFRLVPALPREKHDGRALDAVGRFLFSLWPILLAIALIFGLRLSMILALGATALMTQIVSRLALKERAGLLLRSLDWKSGLLIVSVMVFKKILEVSGALESVTRAIPAHSVWAYVLLFAAPFIMAWLTGVNQAFVGISFPMLLPIFGAGNPDMVLVMFAYVSGFVGILLSPVHLCLATTLQYFKASLRDVYKILLAPAAVVWAAALLALVVFRVVL
jgi:integral membrane protein (TIGR00529 family)